MPAIFQSLPAAPLYLSQERIPTDDALDIADLAFEDAATPGIARCEYLPHPQLGIGML